MKNLIFIGILLFSAVSFGQSKKKTNERLAKELVIEKKNYDSLSSLYKTSLAELVSERLQAGSLLYKSLRNINYSIEEQRYKLNQLRNIFFALKMEENAPVHIYNDTLPGYYELKLAIESMMDFKYSEKEPIMPLNLSEIKKIDERNSKMSEQLESYRDQSAVFRGELISMNTTKLKFIEFNSNSNQIFQEYSEEYNRLTEEYILKSRELNAIKKQFQEKGPKGYAPEYFIAFPDVFPKETELARVQNVVINQVPEQNPQVVDEFKNNSTKGIVPEVAEIVEEAAEFPGGRDSLVVFLSSNIHYPDFAFQNKIGGKSYVQFVIQENGKVSDVRTIKGVPYCKECDKEAIRVVQSMPNWKPGKINGKAINSLYTLPILFKVP